MERRGFLLLELLVLLAFGYGLWSITRAPNESLASYGLHQGSQSDTQDTPALPGTAPPGMHGVQGPPTVDAALIERVLQKYNSPALAAGGQIWIELGKRYRVDPVYALAFFIRESGGGTDPGWAGHKSDGGTTHNIGNIICAGFKRCYGKFRDYDSWEEGIEGWFKLIHDEYIPHGRDSVESILAIYVEGDPTSYINDVIGFVDAWRQGNL